MLHNKRILEAGPGRGDRGEPRPVRLRVPARVGRRRRSASSRGRPAREGRLRRRSRRRSCSCCSRSAATSCGRTSARTRRARTATTLFAKFRDASGLPTGSKVVVAGLPQGRGHEARGRGPLRAASRSSSSNDIPVWSSARRRSRRRPRCSARTTSRSIRASRSQQAPDGTKQTFTPLGADVPRRTPTPIDNASRDAVPPDPERRRGDHARPADPPHRADAAERRPRARERARSVRGRAPHRQRADGSRSPSASTASSSARPARSQTIIERADRSMAEDRADRRTTSAAITQGRRSEDREDPRRTSTTRRPRRRTSSRPRSSELEQTGDALRGKLDKLDGVIDEHRVDHEEDRRGQGHARPARQRSGDRRQRRGDHRRREGLPRHAVRPQGLRRPAQRVQRAAPGSRATT